MAAGEIAMNPRVRSWPGRRIAWLPVAVLVAGIGLAAFVLLPERPLSQKAREALLRTNLKALRGAVAAYKEAHGKGPTSLQELATERFLRSIPVDPMNGSSATWEVERADDGTILAVHSVSDQTARDGSRYCDW
jgi:general secretion pathway protein G